MPPSLPCEAGHKQAQRLLASMTTSAKVTFPPRAQPHRRAIPPNEPSGPNVWHSTISSVGEGEETEEMG